MPFSRGKNRFFYSKSRKERPKQKRKQKQKNEQKKEK